MQNIAESLKRQREQILGDAPEEIPGRNTSLLEIAVISLYNRLANRLAQDIEVSVPVGRFWPWDPLPGDRSAPRCLCPSW